MIKIENLENLEDAARAFISYHGDNKIFAFHGTMGVGKTTFIKAICKQLGTFDNVTSPTFSIVNEYKTKDGKSIFHFDFYRIKDIDEVYDLGYEEYLYSGNYCFIEWPGKIDSLLPGNTVSLLIKENEKGERILTWN